MRIVITLEDTTRGIAMDARVFHNDINDHHSKSIAYLVAAQVETRVREMATKNLIVVRPLEDNATH